MIHLIQDYKLKEFLNKISYRSIEVGMDEFGAWWSIYKNKSKEDRLSNYQSLPPEERLKLRQSFISDGWCHLFAQNHIDECLDLIKDTYSIDLIDLRIKALKFNKVFLVDKTIWERIRGMVVEYEPLFNSDIFFGGLTIKPWGKKKQFVSIFKKRNY